MSLVVGLCVFCSIVVWCLGLKLAYFVWWMPKRMTELLKKQRIEGPPYRILFGNTRENANMIKHSWSKPMDLSHDISPRVIPFIHHSMKKYGKNFVTWHGRQPRVVITSPQHVKEVFNKLDDFEKIPLTPLTSLLTKGLASQNGEKWRKNRRLLINAFHLDKLKAMISAVHSSCNAMMKRWEQLGGVAHGSFELDVWDELQKLTCDIIAKTAFGSSYQQGKRIFELQEQQAQLLAQATGLIYLPGLSLLPTKDNIKRKKLYREVNTMLMDLIRTRLGETEEGIRDKDDLLHLLLEANIIKEGIHHHEIISSKKTERMSMEDIMEECKLFYFAGQDTTSVLLTWTMVLLSMNPHWQDRARDEVLQECGKETPTMDNLNQLMYVYVTMILHEVLRLYPPVILMLRRIRKPVTLGEFNLPSGIEVQMPVLLIHRDNEIWGEDSGEFNPARFSSGITNASKNQVAFFPFGWGQRTCIGQTFAMMEAKLTLAIILQHFSFKLSPSYVHAPHMVITLQPQHGAHLILDQLLL